MTDYTPKILVLQDKIAKLQSAQAAEKALAWLQDPASLTAPVNFFVVNGSSEVNSFMRDAVVKAMPQIITKAQALAQAAVTAAGSVS